MGAAAGSPAPSITGIYSLSNPFRSGVQQQFTSSLAGTANNLGIPLNTMLHHPSTPDTYNFNFGVEYELPHRVVFSAGYVGSRGLFIPLGTADLNQLDLGAIANYGASLDHVRTMGAQDFDLSLYKNLSLGKEGNLRFEISSYDLGNRAQIGMPGVPNMTAVTTNPSQAAAFGQVTATVNSPGQFQFGSRFTF